MPELSPRLAELLNGDGSAAEAIIEIASYPSLVAEAEAALPKIETFAKAPAGRGPGSSLRMVIGRRFVLFPQPDRSDGEWAEWWSDYEDVLSDVPLASLEAAMSAYIRQPDAEFLPKPGQLLKLAKSIPARPIQAYQRAEAAVRAAQRHTQRINAPQTIDPPKVRPMPTEHDRAAVQRMRAAYDAQVDARAKPNTPDRPPIHGATDETGITAQMRELLQRQAEANGQQG